MKQFEEKEVGKGTKVRKMAGCLVFCIIVSCLLGHYISVMRNKSEIMNSCTIKDFEPDTIDVLFLGSSQMIYAAQPMQLWDEYGIASYNMATSATAIPGNYWSAKIAFERQKPRVVVLDCTFAYMTVKVFDEISRTHVVLDNFWPSKAAYEAVNDLIDDPEDRLGFYFSPYLYHTRWKELSQIDYEPDTTFFDAGASLCAVMTDFSGAIAGWDENAVAEVPEVVMEYIEKLKALCEEHDAALVLSFIPSPMFVPYQAYYNFLVKWAEGQNVGVINGFSDEAHWNIDYATDWQDSAHMNIHGSEKATRVFGEYLTANFDLKRDSSHDTTSYYDTIRDKYEEFEKSVIEFPILKFGESILFDVLEGNSVSYYGCSAGGSLREGSATGYYWTTGKRSDYYFRLEDIVDAKLTVNVNRVWGFEDKKYREVDVYLNEEYLQTIKVPVSTEPESFEIEVPAEYWREIEKPQKLTFQYNDFTNYSDTQKYTFDMKEILLEKN